jgi:hypothetical protein
MIASSALKHYHCSMTIRKSLMRWYWFTILGLTLIFALGLMWRGPESDYTIRNVTLVVLGLFMYVVLALKFRCPRCRASLVTKSASILHGRPCGCPKCGVGMDELID